jgi:hypothetical protein
MSIEYYPVVEDTSHERCRRCRATDVLARDLVQMARDAEDDVVWKFGGISVTVSPKDRQLEVQERIQNIVLAHERRHGLDRRKFMRDDGHDRRHLEP